MIELIEPLEIGQTYYGSFYTNPAWGGTLSNPPARLATNNIGMLFTMEPRPWVWGDPVPTTVNYAHIHYPDIISDTVAWTLVSGSFVADSAYRFLSIGNHFSNAETDTLPFASDVGYPKGYAFIDNVCVSTDPEGCPMAMGMHGHPMDGIAVFPNPAITEILLGGLLEGTVVFITDAPGRMVWEGRPAQWDWRINVSGWARGSYVLRMVDGDHQRSFKFMLMD